MLPWGLQVVGWGAQGHSPQGGSSDLRKPPLHKVLQQGNFKIRTPCFLAFNNFLLVMLTKLVTLAFCFGEIFFP